MSIDNPELYEEAKKIADATYKKPSAYKSGFIVKKYKELGGTYSGKKENKGINRWFKEEWKDVGKKDYYFKNYPVYRPTKRITKDTPLTVQEINPSNLKKQIDLKQIIKGDANLPPFLSNLKKELEGKGVNCQNIPSFSRVGSKKKMLNDILSYFPNDNWDTFVEPFAGSAQVYKGIEKEPNKKYILNDKNKDIYNIWKNMKSVDSEKMDTFDWKGSKKQFNYLKDVFKPKTKEEELYKDLYLSRYSYGNMRGNYADKKKRDGGIHYKYVNCSNEIQDIMKTTKILNQDYKKVIKDYDSLTTLFYIDPPYFNKEILYENQSVNPKELKDILSKIKGKFILSYNDVPEVTNEFSDFNIYKVPVRYQWRAGKDKKQTERIVNELIITNYPKEKKGGSVETDNFDERGIVSLPEFRSVKINLPTYMYKIQPYIGRKPPPYRYKLVIPITSSRNISSRKKETSLIINQKPISNPTFDIENSIEGQVEPRLEQFSPADRRKIQTYYNKVKQNERLNPNEVDKDDYEIIPRGRPLPCEGANNRKAEPKKSKNLGKEGKILSKEPKKLGKEGSFLDNLKEQIKDKPKKTKQRKKVDLIIEEPKEDLFAKLIEPDKPNEEKADLTKEQIISRIENLEKEQEYLEKKVNTTEEEDNRWKEIQDELKDLMFNQKNYDYRKDGKKRGKGLLSKNKILSNNRMTNPWIEYVKSYAAKNGMSYRDALRCPKCKAGYKKGSKVGMGVVDEIGNQDLLAEIYNDSELGANAGKKYISL